MPTTSLTTNHGKNELPHDKTNKVSVRSAKTQISLGIRPVWSESSLSIWRKVGSLATVWSEFLLCAQWVAKDPTFLHTDSEDSDQTGRMPRLIWVFVGRTTALLVLSWGGSNVFNTAFISIGIESKWADSWQNQQNDLCARGRLRSVWASISVWSESLLCTQWSTLRSLAYFIECTAKTLIRLRRMPRLIWVFAGHTSFCWLSLGGSIVV